MSSLKHKVIYSLRSHKREVTLDDSDDDNPMGRYNGSLEKAAYPQAVLAAVGAFGGLKSQKSHLTVNASQLRAD